MEVIAKKMDEIWNKLIREQGQEAISGECDMEFFSPIKSGQYFE
jgi:hypothetical protein